MAGVLDPSLGKRRCMNKVLGEDMSCLFFFGGSEAFPLNTSRNAGGCESDKHFPQQSFMRNLQPRVATRHLKQRKRGV